MAERADEEQLRADIERIWHDLAAGRADAERERAEAVARGEDLEQIGETLRGFSAKRRRQIAARERRDARG